MTQRLSRRQQITTRSWDDTTGVTGQQFAGEDSTASTESAVTSEADVTVDAPEADGPGAGEVGGERGTISPMAPRDDLDPEETRRAALVDSLPVVY